MLVSVGKQCKWRETSRKRSSKKTLLIFACGVQLDKVILSYVVNVRCPGSGAIFHDSYASIQAYSERQRNDVAMRVFRKQKKIRKRNERRCSH